MRKLLILKGSIFRSGMRVRERSGRPKSTASTLAWILSKTWEDLGVRDHRCSFQACANQENRRSSEGLARCAVGCLPAPPWVLRKC